MGNIDEENQRAYRIGIRTKECHDRLTDIYESLVDRDFVIAEKEVKTIMIQLRLILKSIEEDDF
jgi:hypothetical protein